MFLEKLFGLKGKVALVTGGSRGIGQSVAIGLAKAGAEVALFSRSCADETVKMIEQEGGKAYSIQVDVVDEAAVVAGIEAIFEKSGSLDMVFNNAGVCIHTDVTTMPVDDWRNLIDINLTGEFIVARASAKKMIEKGIKGSIINMASMSAGVVNKPNYQAAYNSSKAAIVMMTRSMAMEWVQYGIRVNSISPGYIATDMALHTPQELQDIWKSQIPVGRLGKPEELLPPILYLASDMSGYTTGSDVVVDGGYSCL